MLNSHDTAGKKCVEIVKTLHVKFFPFGSPAPYGRVTVKTDFLAIKWPLMDKPNTFSDRADYDLFDDRGQKYNRKSPLAISHYL